MVRFKIESKYIFSTLKKLSIKDSLMGKILVVRYPLFKKQNSIIEKFTDLNRKLENYD